VQCRGRHSPSSKAEPAGLWGLIAGIVSASRGVLDWIAALNDPDEHYDNREYKQEMDIGAQRVKRNHPQQPQDHENYGNGPKHR